MMNKITKSLIALIIMLFCNQYLAGQEEALSGDMGFKMLANNNYTMQVTMTCVSIPFEGLTNPRDQFKPYNRVGKVQNGSIWRFFTDQNTLGAERNIYKISSNMLNYNDVFDLMHSSGSEFEASINYVYGYAKYLVEVNIYYNDVLSEKYKYYYNTLDSKFGGKDTLTDSTYYIGDLYVRYNTSLPSERRLEIFKDVRSGVPNPGLIPIDTISTSDTLNDGTPKKELKVWEIKYPSSSFPEEQNFYASTTPFGLRPEIIEDQKLSEYIIGTKVVFDTVYNNKDNPPNKTDTIGYNTRNDNTYYMYYTNPPVGFNDSGNTYTTTAWVVDINDAQKGITLIADSSTTLEFKKNKKLWINGTGDENIHDILKLRENSKIIHFENSGLYAFRYGKIIDEGCNITWAPNTIHRAYQNTEFEYKGTEHIVNNGGKVQIDGNAKLSLAANTTLTFDGNNTNLELNPNSIVQLGENAKIEFKNGAYLIADGSSISSVQGSHGGGILLENAGEQTSITNCTFTNLRNSIFVKNTDAGYFGAFKNISNNTFYTDASCNYVIETKNAANITISNNHVYMTQGKGVGILMRYYINEGNEETPSTSYAVNVMGNEISNGVVSAAFISFTNSYPYVNFKYNNCYGNISSTNVAYRQSHGNIKNNILSNTSGKNLDLIQANPDVLSNTFYSYIMNLTNNDSYPIFAPVSSTTDGGWVWRGGKNTISSTSNGNIYFNNGNVLLDWGQNYFSKSYSHFHLQGRINEPSGVYYVRNNCFNGSHDPSSSLRDYYSDTTVVIPYYTGSYINCSISTDAGTIWSIDDLGNGFYDTLYRTNDNSGYQPEEDEGLYSSAIEKMLNDDNYGAVSTFKTLINLYPQSSYTEACIYDMYDCYLKLDTSANQTTHDILYSDLKYFLDSRIESGLYSDEFNLNAYNITVMCLASISQYYEAMSGYEFIALYHPDDYLSFLASWDYAEIEDLMNGSGGISSKEENLTQEEYYKKLKKRIDRKINEDPVKKMVKKSFDRTKAAKISKIEKDAMSRTNSNETAKQEIAKMKSKYEEAKMKAVSIMRTSKSLTREEKDRKQIEDILLTRTEESKEIAAFSNIVPSEFSLSQNYPNPFNPVTKINFALPKQGFVTLKIYDVTGREIKTLVNEVKQAGYYTVDFNGSHLSSGVYFYKIQSGDFSSVKRMVLIK